MSKESAKLKLAEFRRHPESENPKWPYLSRYQIADDLSQRIDNPNKIAQEKTSLCGASSFFHELVTKDPDKYVQAAIDLFEKGQATIGKLTLKPCSDLMNYKLNTSDIAAGDWILAASLRDSGNWFMDYQSSGDNAAAITFPNTMAGWFSKAGYQDVRNETNLVVCKDWDNAMEASELKFRRNYNVCLFINKNMLEDQTTPSVIPNHWVVLMSKIEKVWGDCCRFECFSWGNLQRVPELGVLTIKHFLWNYYGYVACKY